MELKAALLRIDAIRAKPEIWYYLIEFKEFLA
jgi:hypothetical protein